MIKYTLNFINLIHLCKVTVNEKKLKVTYYFDGKIDAQTFADQADFDEAVAEVEGVGLLQIGETWYNKDRLSIVVPNGASCGFHFIGNVFIDHEYADASEVDAVVDEIEPQFIQIGGKWYQGKQIHVAKADAAALTINYDYLGQDYFVVQYEDQAAYDAAVEKLESLGEGGEGGAKKVKTPKFQPSAGVVEKGTIVTITCATAGATIHYTTDETTPTTDSPVYSTPITVNGTTVIKAMAVAADLKNSNVASGRFVVNIPQVAKPTFSVPAGTVESGTQVEISCATEGAVIHYTDDGTDPTADSPEYTGAITITTSKTIKAIGVKEDWTDSQIASAAYHVDTPTVANPVFSPNGGAVDAGTEVTITCATPGATIYYTTDGSTPDETSTEYTAPITIDAATTVKAIAKATDMADSSVVTKEFTIKLYKYAGVFNNPDEDTDVIPPATDMTLEWLQNLTDVITPVATEKNLGGMGDEHLFTGINQINNGRVVYAYPASLGNLDAYIQNSSRQNITNSFTKLTNTVAGVEYNIYILTDSSGSASLPYAFV